MKDPKEYLRIATANGMRELTEARALQALIDCQLDANNEKLEILKKSKADEVKADLMKRKKRVEAWEKEAKRLRFL